MPACHTSPSCHTATCANSRCTSSPTDRSSPAKTPDMLIRDSDVLELGDPSGCECSVEEGEQTLDAALERVSDAVDAIDVGAGHDAVAHHDEVLCGVLWFATPR